MSRIGWLPAVVPLCAMAAALFSASAPRANAAVDAQVLTGADVLLRDSLHLVAGKRLGVVCNRASVLHDGEHVLDALKRSGIDVAAVFSPEHGFDAAADAGSPVPDEYRSDVPVLSLYGKTLKPARSMLEGLEAMVFDLQDIGVRYYTYVSTLALCMEAAAENGLPVIVLDRPNPINGISVEGPVLDTAMRSFVGMFPIPVRHGMTIAELALMIAGERWINAAEYPDLKIVPMKGWRREMWFEETGLPWMPPSPNIRSVDAALAYAGTCLLEGTAVSEGRGADLPFLCLGAPFLNAEETTSAMASSALSGVRFEEVVFTPKRTPGATRPKHEGVPCRGLRLVIEDRETFRPFKTGIVLLGALARLAPAYLAPTGHLDALVGLKGFRNKISGNLADLLDGPEMARRAAEFETRRAVYLMPSY